MTTRFLVIYLKAMHNISISIYIYTHITPIYTKRYEDFTKITKKSHLNAYPQKPHGHLGEVLLESAIRKVSHRRVEIDKVYEKLIKIADFHHQTHSVCRKIFPFLQNGRMTAVNLSTRK